MRIEPARSSDRGDVLGLLQAQLAEHAIPLAADRLAAAVDGVLAEPARGSLLVATVDAVAVGVAYVSFTWTIEHGGAVAWLEELYVRPEHRGRGVGGALVAEACACARAAGCAAVDLEVEASQERAIRLYARRGFRRLTRTRFSLSLR